jgi:hypothetical protein
LDKVLKTVLGQSVEKKFPNLQYGTKCRILPNSVKVVKTCCIIKLDRLIWLRLGYG